MSTLKVSNIQDISNNAAMSISGGVVTFSNTLTAPPAANTPIQILQSQTASQVYYATVAYIATPLTKTITPKFSNSKIMISINVPYWMYNNEGVFTNIYRTYSGSSAFLDANYVRKTETRTDGGSEFHSLDFVEAAPTSSAITYTVYFKPTTTAGVFFCEGAKNIATMVLTEISS
jgi:hypothetical protein